MSEDRRIPTTAPADRPTFKILVGGRRIPPEYEVLSVDVRRTVNAIASAQLTIYDGDPAAEDFAVSSTEYFVPGNEVEVLAGYHSDDTSVFKGIVIRHEVKVFSYKPSVLIVECKDAAVRMSVGRKNRYYYDVTDGDVIEEVAIGAGLQAEVEATTGTNPEMVQFNATDWDFVVSRAESQGMLVFTRDGTLVVEAPDLQQDPVLSLTYGGNIIDLEMEMDARRQYRSVSASSWNAANQEMLELEGENGASTLLGNISVDDLAGAVGLDRLSLKHAGQLSDAEVQAWANAQTLKSTLAKVRGRVRFQGIAGIRPGQMVELGGMGERFNGKAFVAGVRHQMDVNNWETDIEVGLSSEWFTQSYADVTAPRAAGLLPAVGGLQIGLVTKLEGDPQGEDRVQVRIPMISPEEEGVWARVATLDAGENRGTFFRPEIGDEVILGFLNDDPRNPVVLGMVNSSAKPAPLQASDDNNEKGLVTRSEMKVLFNDETKTVTIETPNGNRLEVSDDAGGIMIGDENGNKVVLDSAGIALESAGDITLKASGDLTLEGTNVTASAAAQLKSEGSAGAEISSSGTTTVKGALVQIN